MAVTGTVFLPPIITMINTTGTVTFGFDPAVVAHNGDTVQFTYTVSSTNGGDWWMPDVDMRHWPADDIIDYYARDLARRRPA
jgi:hypothetical protein